MCGLVYMFRSDSSLHNEILDYLQISLLVFRNDLEYFVKASYFSFRVLNPIKDGYIFKRSTIYGYAGTNFDIISQQDF